MKPLLRLLFAVMVSVVCFFVFPLSLGSGGALEALSREASDVPRAWRADLAVRFLGVVPDPDVDPLLYVFRENSPRLSWYFVLMSFFAPGVLFLICSSIGESVVRVWVGRIVDVRTRGRLPPWPLRPDDAAPRLCIGEVHYKTKLAESPHPKWLMMPEKGLYTGLIIFGAVGTGKTTSCMRPFCRQLLEWQSGDPAKRAAALVLEVKGDFCYEVKEMLAEYGRSEDYMELSLERTGWRWNPLNAPWMDTYSLAYSLASLVNQLFGKSKEPFWQMAYTNVIRWVILTYRALPGSWFTFADIYKCMLDKEELEALIDRQTSHVYGQYEYEVHVHASDYDANRERLTRVMVTEQDVEKSIEQAGQPVEGAGERHQLTLRCLGPKKAAREHVFKWERYGDRCILHTGDVGYSVIAWEMRKDGATLDFGAAVIRSPPPEDLELNKEIDRWYKTDWLDLDEKLRSSIVEGMSVFLATFVVPSVARIFCPKNPELMTADEKAMMMPSLDQLIESGKVLALNMPAGTNPALARAAGVLLKQSWLSTLLLRPKEMKVGPKDKFWRPAVFICDEYQMFATCGGSDPSGDEKAFALTRQSKCVPIVATQSISSLKSALGDDDTWRALLQTLRSRIFLSLADDFSAQRASELLGQVNRMRASFSLSETTGKASASLLTGRMGGGSASAGFSKSYSEKREPLFHPRDLVLLGVCQAVAQIFDGAVVKDATRVYLKADYRPRSEPYWKWYREVLSKAS